MAKGALVCPFAAGDLAAAAAGTQNPQSDAMPPGSRFTEEELLEEIVSRAFLFFWNEANPRSGLVRDRALADGGPDPRRVASIAATGFGLAALCIGHKRGYLPPHRIGRRVVSTLSFLLNHAEQVNGFFYHFLDIETGKRARFSEVSPIDTSLLLCGVLMAREYFHDAKITQLANTIYRRVNWRWMLNGGKTFALGWTPEYKFIGARWDSYCELMMMYLLAIAAPVYNISPSSWNEFSRPAMEFEGYSYISGPDPLFVHQYSHAWFDFRNVHDQYANYFQNSAIATYAHKLFCLSLRWRFPDYDDRTWGITASDSRLGYQAWGGPPEIGYIDGTVVPCATAGSLPFLPGETAAVLTNLYNSYGMRAWKRYGFVDAFNPRTRWTDVDVLGIDQGITLLMVENHRTGFVWEMFMRSHEAQRAMKLVGFQPVEASAGLEPVPLLIPARRGLQPCSSCPEQS
ncbi:MAG TPA: glucoamylase family protein [Candidatus Binatia bacterium]|nr:glucoamylase family protein [Candidatus Binatia bacterium]